MSKFILTYPSGSKLIGKRVMGQLQKRELIFSKMEVDINFYEHNNEQCANLQYGFNPHYTEHSVKDPGCRRENYRLHHSVTPGKSCELLHEPSGRKFHFANHAGFVCYTCDLIETATGKKVATIYYEDYYKD